MMAVKPIDSRPDAVLEEACRLARSDESAVSLPPMHRTTVKSITRRGVVWLGQTCNLRCSFCYFIDRVANHGHPEHGFMPLEKAMKICRTLVDYYANTAVDLQGGEPTLYSDIVPLVSYCRDIGLAPTLITNALLLDDVERCRSLRNAGMQDALVSVQGLGEVHDYLVGCSGAHRRQMIALGNLRRLGIPVRFNVVMSAPVTVQLPDIARLAIRCGVCVVNFITFNPFADQATGRRASENVPRYQEAAPYLTEALDLLEDAGIEANVRYFPFCQLEERHRGNGYNFQQLSYDPHEWDFASWGWTGLQPQREARGGTTPPTGLIASRAMGRMREPLKKIAGKPLMRRLMYGAHGLMTRFAPTVANCDALYRKVARMHAEVYCGYVHGDACVHCSLQPICDGFHGDYAAMFGMGEAEAVAGEKRDNPRLYISQQEKVEVFLARKELRE